jgi:hypothetical protein
MTQASKLDQPRKYWDRLFTPSSCLAMVTTVDADGFVIWDRVKSAHYCGAPDEDKFVAAYQTMQVDVPYEGPEVEAALLHSRAMFAGD